MNVDRRLIGAKEKNDMGLLETVQIVLLIMKLAGAVTWSWGVVFLPVWIFVVIEILIWFIS